MSTPSESEPAASQAGLPASYTPVRVYAAELAMQLVDPAALPAGTDPQVEFFWDWDFAESEAVAVTFGIQIGGTQARYERIRAAMVGLFALPDQHQITLDLFVASNAVVMLFPYLRAAVGSLTMHGGFGAYVLPLLNVPALAKGFDQHGTSGFRALTANLALRARWTTILSPEYLTALSAGASVPRSHGQPTPSGSAKKRARRIVARG